MNRIRRYLRKERTVKGTVTSWEEITQHVFVNFLFGLTGGLVIASIVIANPWIILVSYYINKRFESKVLNRNKYTTKLGKDIIFPIPSSIGFLIGYIISTIIKELINNTK